jgi:hypothetical protein
MKKVCFKCEQEKNITEFYRHSEMFDGHLGKCKECTKTDNRNNRARRLSYYRKYDRARHTKGYVLPLREKHVQSWSTLVYRSWTGSKSQYRSLHHWVQRQLGKPSVCEECKRGNLSGHNIHWANKTGNYQRDKNDWVRLRARCHMKHDQSAHQRKA